VYPDIYSCNDFSFAATVAAAAAVAMATLMLKPVCDVNSCQLA